MRVVLRIIAKVQVKKKYVMCVASASLSGIQTKLPFANYE
jgi:hypothetical protein